MNKNIIFFLTLILFIIQSCYYQQAITGHINIIFSKKPLQKVIDRNLYPKYQNHLLEIIRIKEFGITQIKLKNTNSYSDYFHTTKQGITNVITAAYPTKLQSFTWKYPIVGSLPFRGYFNQIHYENELEKLLADGLDIWHFHSIAYSTLGWFDDPVTTPMLNRGIGFLAESIFHEMTHETYYKKEYADYNEQLASFVGNKAAKQYIQKYHNNLNKINKNDQRYKQVNEILLDTKSYLKDLYEKEISEEEKIRKKKIITKLASLKIGKIFPNSNRRYRTVNNARLLQITRYSSKTSEIEDIWEKSGQNWVEFWKLVNINKR